MTLTRTQMHERATSLSGELKAAREAQSECENALQDRERIVTIAKQALERANTRVDDLLAERAQLAADMANAILQVGEAPLADEAAPAVDVEIVTEQPYYADFGKTDYESPLYANGAEQISRAFDEATQP